jgi:hypothetical protein
VMLLGLFLTLASVPQDDPWIRLRPRVANAPGPVARFIERRAGCNHFLGEEPFDRARAEELNRIFEELRCARIERDERGLRQRYRGSPAILHLLTETEDLIGW